MIFQPVRGALRAGSVRVSTLNPPVTQGMFGELGIKVQFLSSRTEPVSHSSDDL